jgi:hypothetical protein
MTTQRFFFLTCFAQVVIGAICANLIGVAGLVLALLILFIPVIGATLSSISIYFLGPFIEEAVRCKLVGVSSVIRVGFGLCYGVGFWLTERAIALKGKVSLSELQQVAQGNFTDLSVTFADTGVSALLIHAGLTCIAVYSYKTNYTESQADISEQNISKFKASANIIFVLKLSICHLSYNILLFLVISLGNYSPLQQGIFGIFISLVCLAVLAFNLNANKAKSAYTFRTVG